MTWRHNKTACRAQRISFAGDTVRLYAHRETSAGDSMNGVLVGGTSSDPGLQQGAYSALVPCEERILTSTFRHAIAG
jgi:hypothetical protein